MALDIETNRLHLRKFRDVDCHLFSAYRSDPLIAKYQSWDVPFGLAQARRFIEEMDSIVPGTPGEWFQIAIVLKSTSTLIGDCAFHVFADDPRQAEIGFTLARAHQGQGLAFEAVSRLLAYFFEDFQLHRLQATADVENLASVKLLERIGMRREAHFIENVWFKEEWRSEYVYALLQREWENFKTQSQHPSRRDDVP